MNNNELKNLLTDLKTNYQMYLNTEEKDQIETLLQTLTTSENFGVIETQYLELKKKIDERKSATEKIQNSMSDKQKQTISDWSDGNR